MNIVLIGYRCCGKTSVGKLLSAKLDREFIDTDDLIIEKEGCSIDEIVSIQGWDYFRETEKDVIKEVSTMENIVIATGGGVVTNEENVEKLQNNGFIVWLYADIDTIKKRLNEDKTSPDNRPSLTGDEPSDEIKKVLEQRKPLYLKASDMAVDTSQLNINEVADMIIEETGKRK
ncbi:MAG: shikimate kinase [Desulfobacteraceae bacterium]|jgi:shikimate kinase